MHKQPTPLVHKTTSILLSPDKYLKWSLLAESNCPKGVCNPSPSLSDKEANMVAKAGLEPATYRS